LDRVPDDDSDIELSEEELAEIDRAVAEFFKEKDPKYYF
jgi:hypothetical protein